MARKNTYLHQTGEEVQALLDIIPHKVEYYDVRYGETTAEEIGQAIAAGKTPRLMEDNIYARMARYEIVARRGASGSGGEPGPFPPVPQYSTYVDFESVVGDVLYVYSLCDATWTRSTRTIYEKPSGGIPASDMSSAVQSSLGKADTAVQEFIVTYGVTTMAEITAAINAGKLPLLVVSENYGVYPGEDTIYKIPLTMYDDSELSSGYPDVTAQFTWVSGATGLVTVYECHYDDDWQVYEYWRKYTKQIPDAQIQSNWNQTNQSAKDYIKNKPNLSLKADKSEMGVSVSGDKTTITLKQGLSAEVINQHQSLTPITSLIPSEATSSNKLADKAYVNSSISTATATYRGNYNVVTDLSLPVDATDIQVAAALLTTIPNEDNNDYAFAQVPTSASTPTEIARIDRYKYNGSAWLFEYSLNNSGFTAAQWAAINSGITSGLVTKLSGLPTSSELDTLLGGKVDKIDGKGLSTNDYDDTEKALVASAYQKPQTGIPSTDLESTVQTSLEKADSAYQKPQTGIPSTDMASGVQTSLGKADSALQPFIAIYGTTSAKDIKDAFVAGDQPILTFSSGSIYEGLVGQLIDILVDGGYVWVTFLSVDASFTVRKFIAKQSADGTGATTWSALDKQIPNAQVQSDWNQTNTSAKDFIKNKPDLSLKADKSEMSVTTSGDQTTITLKSGTSATVINQHQSLTSITDLIPSQATSSNQLADKEFVNNSISTATATFCGTYNLLNNLVLPLDATQAQIGTALANIISGEDNNDYAFVQIPTSDLTPEEIARVDRYKYNGTTWVYEYSLNNSGYTAAQWAAINSGITSGLVTKLSDLPTNSALTTSLDGKANKSEMSVVDGSGADADKTTITLKSGTSATVLKSHQDISGKVDKVTGKGLSTEDYTSAEKTKLGGIDTGAQVNVIETVKVNGTALTVSNKAVDISVPTEFSNAEIDAIWEAN